MKLALAWALLFAAPALTATWFVYALTSRAFG